MKINIICSLLSMVFMNKNQTLHPYLNHIRRIQSQNDSIFHRYIPFKVQFIHIWLTIAHKLLFLLKCHVVWPRAASIFSIEAHASHVSIRWSGYCIENRLKRKRRPMLQACVLCTIPKLPESHHNNTFYFIPFCAVCFSSHCITINSCVSLQCFIVE